MSKSFVGRTTTVCPVCHKDTGGGSVLIHKGMREIFDEHKPMVEGFKMCAEHRKQIDDGYIIVVACDEKKSDFESDHTVKPEGAYLTGPLVAVRKEVWPRVFNVPAPSRGYCFCEQGVIDALAKMNERNERAEEA